MVIMKGMKAWMPNMIRNIPGEMMRMNLKYIFPIRGPAYTAGANAQNTLTFCPKSGRWPLASATKASVVPWLWHTNPSFSNPVCESTREISAGRSSTPICRMFQFHMRGSDGWRSWWSGRKPHRLLPSQTS